MGKILIAYFSHDGEAYVGGTIKALKAGNTRVAAQEIARLTGGDLYRIETVEEYPFVYSDTTVKAKAEKTANARPAIKNPMPDMAQYDTVILCYPNWWGTCPMAVFTFLESGNFDGKQIAPLCTNEGSAMGTSEGDIRKVCPHVKMLKGLPITGSRVADATQQIENWLRGMKL